LANDENLSANIDVSVGIDSASLAQAKKDIEALGAAADAVSEKVGAIGKAKRPSTSKDMLSDASLAEIAKVDKNLSRVLSNLAKETGDFYNELKKLGYEFSVDRKTGQPSIRPSTLSPSERSERAVRQNKYGGDRYIPIDQLSPSGQDTAAIKQMITTSLRKMGFTGINDFIVGGLTTAEDELKKLSLQDIFQEGFTGSLKEDLGSWGTILEDEAKKAEAEWLNKEAKRMSTLIGKIFMPDAMANSGQSADFKIHPEVMSHLQHGTELPKTLNDSFEKTTSLAIQDYISGPGGTPIISPQTFLVAVQDAFANMPDAKGKSHIAENQRKTIQARIESQLGITFDEISNIINQVFEEHDYSADVKYDKQKAKRAAQTSARVPKSEEQKYQETYEDIQKASKKLLGGGASQDKVDALIQSRLEDYFNSLMVSIATDAAKAGEKVISAKMSDHGELKIGDATGALDNMQEYVDRAIIEMIAKREEAFGLRQGTFALKAGPHLPDDLKAVAATAWQTNLPGRPQSRPTDVAQARESVWASGEAPLRILRGLLKGLKDDVQGLEVQKATVQASSEKTGEAVVEAVGNSAVDALKTAQSNPEFQKLKNIIGEELFGQIFDFMARSIQENAGNFTAAWDTEFTDKLKGKAGTILESSLVLKNALGEILNLQTFMHRPAYLAEGGMGVAGVNQAMHVQGAGANSAITSVKAFNDRAKLLGIPDSQLGDLKNAEQNKAELEKKIAALLALINLFDQLQVPLSGQNLMNADFNQLQNTIGYLQSQGSHLRGTGGLSNIVDNAGIIKSMQGSAQVTDPGVIFANANKGNLGQGKLLKQLFEDFKDATAPYASMVEFGKNGFTIKIDGKQLPAHTAQADAIASIIVTEVMRQVSPQFRALMETPGYSWLPAGSVYSSQTMPYADPKKSKSKTDKPAFDMQQRSLEAQVAVSEARAADQQASPAGQAALAEARLTHIVQLYRAIQSVVAGTVQDADKANSGIKGMLKSLFADTEKRAAVLSSQSVRTEAETAELAKANRLLELRKTLLEETSAAEGNILGSTKTLFQINRLLVDDYTVGLAKIEAAEKARSKDAKTVDKMHETLSDTLKRPTLPVNISTVAYNSSGATEMPVGSTRIANPLAQQAGPVFSKQIEAQMKEYVAAEKRVESGNKNMINTWVTARYALYDVGNAFQNVSQRMFMLARQIFNITDAYRSYETAFMPVERAMGLLSDETQGMLDQFIKLSETIPLTVEELSRIATLGAQMGIGASGIVKFTQTVSEFSAITGMSADTIAEKFGRISQLTKLESDQMSNLGSSIAYAGVNAVATEPEILSLAEAIAAVSQRVGILPAEVVGLSTSLASLGVPAEQARGVFTRLFGKIDRAVADGGPTLQKFAKVAGTSADEFKNKWGEAGQSYDLIRGILNGVNNSGKDLTKVFDSLGITETREVNTLTRMAKNLDVVDKSMSDATKAFASNIFLQQAFAKTADTVDSKIKLFQNSIQSFGAEVGKNLSGAFKSVLETLTGLMNGLRFLANDPVMQYLAAMTSGLAAFGGVAAGMISIMSKITAQIYAFRVAMINTANDPTAVTGITKQIKALLNYKTELVEMRDSLQSPNPAARGTITPLSYPMGVGNKDKDRGSYLQKEEQIYRATGKELQQQLDAVSISESKLDSVRKFSNLTSSEQLMYARMEADQINQLVRIRAFEIQALEAEVAKKIQSGALSAEAGAVILNEARSREINYTMINGEIRAISLLTTLEADGIAVSGAVTAAQQAEAAARLENTAAIAAQTRAGAVSGTGALGGLGARLMGIAGWAGLALGVGTAIWGIVDAIRAADEEAKNWHLIESGGGIASLRDAIAKDTVEFYKSGNAIGTAKIKYDEYTATLNKNAEVIQDATGTTIEMNSKTASLTSEVKTQTLALGDNANAWIANSLASNPKVKSLFDQNPNLISDLKKQGIVFADVARNLLNPEIKNPLKSVYDSIEGFKMKMALFKGKNSELQASSAGGTVTFYDNWKDKKSADEYSKMMKQLKTFEKTKALLESLKSTIGSAMSQSAFQKVVNEIFGITDPLDDVNDALARTVKSTRSWASEVAGIFGESFQNRFGKTQALDAINKQWADMRKNVNDAKKAIDETRKSMDSINADKTTLETQLEVAIRYGDTVREQKIRAELAQKTAELGNLQTQLEDQNKIINKKLTGNSVTAIENRSQILSMVQAYDPYIEQILATSNSSKEAKKSIKSLKQEFIDNAMALGFNGKELDKYSKHFDDMLTIVTYKPRDITLNVVKDPALDAIRNFVDQANGDLSKIKDSITIKVKTTDGGKRVATGGLITGPGSSTSDSIPAMLSNGEFVVRASAVSRYGLDFMNSLNQQRVGYSAPVANGININSGSDSQMVYLSPEDRALLRSALDRPVNLYTENTKIAQSANAGNVILAQRGTN
jgi:TP901 family phage tail tape measure protein